MNSISLEEIEQSLKSKTLNYYNFYNLDIPITQQYVSDYYVKNKYDTIEVPQKLNILFSDIEVFTNEEGLDIKGMESEGMKYQAKHPINIVTLCDASNLHLYSYILLFDSNFEKFGIKPNDPTFDWDQFIREKVIWGKQELKNLGYLGSKYIPENFELELFVYRDEKQLLIDMMNKIHELDPDILSGWNSDKFDYPYIFHDLIKLFGLQNTMNMMSKFGYVELRGGLLSIPDYATADLLYLYRKRDESGGGLSYGDKQPVYTLDFIADVELDLRKVEYKSKTTSLDTFFIEDPSMSWIYNIVDVLLTFGLDRKLKHIDLHNMIRRLMSCPFHSSMIGSSSFFEHFVYYKLSQENKVVRTYITNEARRSLTAEMLSQFPQLQLKNGKKVPPVNIVAKGSDTSYSAIINKFPGAFVNDPTPNIVKDNSIIIDLDATALYPSMILQGNISFDSYCGRVIPPWCYPTIRLLETCLGKSAYPNELAYNINLMASKYVDKEDIGSKNEMMTNVYYIIMYLFDVLAKSGLPANQIFYPKSTQESLLLRNTLVPLLDVITTIHPHAKKYNQFAYDYILMDYNSFIALYPEIYILHYPNESNAHLIKYKIQDAIPIIQKHGITLAGTFFNKHDEKLGMFAEFLQRMQNLRNEYRGLLKLNEKDSDDWIFNNNRQKSVKVVMNTTKTLVLILVIVYRKFCELRETPTV